MPGPVNPETHGLRIEGDFGDALFILGARVEEGINLLTETVIEFVCTDREIDLEPLLGSALRVAIKTGDGGERVFPGICVSIEFLGIFTGPAHYRAVLRPRMWFLTRSRNNRIFQNMKVVDIIQKVLGDYGLSSDLKNRLNGTYEPREYTVQYDETDLDFLFRLGEQEGIYFHFPVVDGREMVVLADGVGSHTPVPGKAVLPFVPLHESGHRMGAHVFDWRKGLAATSGKMMLSDFDFETPAAPLKATSSIPKGIHKGNDHELYDTPGRFRKPDLGSQRARIGMEAVAAKHHTVRGAANVMNLEVGGTFKLDGHARAEENADWMVTRATHLMRARPSDIAPLGVSAPISEDLSVWQGGGLGGGEAAEKSGDDPYRILFSAVPKTLQYRTPLVTPWPRVVGVHTAFVTGKAGEEIHTDKYGRIKIQFHWDRDGKKDENTTCWVRCMTPWSGKQWGAIAIPRMGQEVVVQFEDGDPDRPLVIGMLYNADNMPPWDMPANKTQSGVKTDSSKGGGGFNELMFEDKKGAELVRFQAERDFRQIVKNDAEITVGLEHKDKGDMKLTVHRHLSETVKTGDHDFTVAAGNQTIKVKKDLDETVEGKETQTVTLDANRTVKQGNVSDTIKMGNYTQTLDIGNHATKVKLGNVAVNADLGKITMEAMQSIELKVGGSSIKIDQMGVTIKGAMMASMDGTLKTDIKGTMVNVQGQAMLVLKGGITMIN